MGRELALHMKRGLELARRQQVSVDAPKASTQDINEEPGAAFAAGKAGVALEFPRQGIAADNVDGVGGIDGFRRIGAAMHGLARWARR